MASGGQVEPGCGTGHGADHGDPREIHTRTLDAIRAAGFDPNLALWPAASHGDCYQCHSGCTDSPQ